MKAAVGRGGEMPTIALGSTAQNPQERKQNENTLSEIWDDRCLEATQKHCSSCMIGLKAEKDNCCTRAVYSGCPAFAHFHPPVGFGASWYPTRGLGSSGHCLLPTMLPAPCRTSHPVPRGCLCLAPCWRDSKQWMADCQGKEESPRRYGKRTCNAPSSAGKPLLTKPQLLLQQLGEKNKEEQAGTASARCCLCKGRA